MEIKTNVDNRCANCKYCTIDISDFGILSLLCNNKFSECYGTPVTFNDSCEFCTTIVYKIK